MSILSTSSVGWLISHEAYINKIYDAVTIHDEVKKFKINPNLFKIENSFTRKSAGVLVSKDKCSQIQNIEDVLDPEEVNKLFTTFKEEVKFCNSFLDESVAGKSNTEATLSAEEIYKNSEKVLEKAFGKNVRSDAIAATINNESYLFPPNCEFYCKNISEIPSVIGDKIYDLILLDPPWWNKYIRRKRSKNEKAAYNMIYNEDLKKLPLENMISDHGLIVVWCTNSNKHQVALLNDIFIKWKVKFYTTWYWIKITCSGIPICSFSKPPRKQPYEQIFIASKCASLEIPKSKIIVSVPSALHSHKPPLEEILKEFLPNQPKCLEVFARYLLPKWTSWGLEVLRFQHNSLYIIN